MICRFCFYWANAVSLLWQVLSLKNLLQLIWLLLLMLTLLAFVVDFIPSRAQNLSFFSLLRASFWKSVMGWLQHNAKTCWWSADFSQSQQVSKYKALYSAVYFANSFSFKFCFNSQNNSLHSFGSFLLLLAMHWVNAFS